MRSVALEQPLRRRPGVRRSPEDVRRKTRRVRDAAPSGVHRGMRSGPPLRARSATAAGCHRPYLRRSRIDGDRQSETIGRDIGSAEPSMFFEKRCPAPVSVDADDRARVAARRKHECSVLRSREYAPPESGARKTLSMTATGEPSSANRRASNVTTCSSPSRTPGAW